MRAFTKRLALTSNWKRIFGALRLLLVGAALVLISLYLVNNAHAIAEQFSIYPNWGYLIVSFLCVVAASGIYAAKIRAFFQVFGVDFPFVNVLVISCRSALLAILPGGIWNHVNLGGELYHLRAACTLKQMTLLIMVMAGVDALAVLLLLPLLANEVSMFLLTLALGCVVIAIIFAAVIISNRLARFDRAPRIGHLVATLGLLWVYWSLIGAAFTFMMLAFRQPIPAFGTNVAVYDLAWLAGFLFLPAPSGIGVREFVLQQLYNGLGGGVTYGVIFSIIFRVITIIRDVLLTFVSPLALSRRSLNTGLHSDIK